MLRCCLNGSVASSAVDASGATACGFWKRVKSVHAGCLAPCPRQPSLQPPAFCRALCSKAACDT